MATYDPHKLIEQGRELVQARVAVPDPDGCRIDGAASDQVAFVESGRDCSGMVADRSVFHG